MAMTPYTTARKAVRQPRVGLIASARKKQRLVSKTSSLPSMLTVHSDMIHSNISSFCAARPQNVYVEDNDNSKFCTAMQNSVFAVDNDFITYCDAEECVVPWVQSRDNCDNTLTQNEAYRSLNQVNTNEKTGKGRTSSDSQTVQSMWSLQSLDLDCVYSSVGNRVERYGSLESRNAQPSKTTNDQYAAVNCRKRNLSSSVSLPGRHERRDSGHSPYEKTYASHHDLHNTWDKPQHRTRSPNRRARVRRHSSSMGTSGAGPCQSHLAMFSCSSSQLAKHDEWRNGFANGLSDDWHAGKVSSGSHGLNPAQPGAEEDLGYNHSSNPAVTNKDPGYVRYRNTRRAERSRLYSAMHLEPSHGYATVPHRKKLSTVSERSLEGNGNCSVANDDSPNYDDHKQKFTEAEGRNWQDIVRKSKSESVLDSENTYNFPAKTFDECSNLVCRGNSTESKEKVSNTVKDDPDQQPHVMLTGMTSGSVGTKGSARDIDACLPSAMSAASGQGHITSTEGALIGGVSAVARSLSLSSMVQKALPRWLSRTRSSTSPPSHSNFAHSNVGSAWDLSKLTKDRSVVMTGSASNHTATTVPGHFVSALSDDSFSTHIAQANEDRYVLDLRGGDTAPDKATCPAEHAVCSTQVSYVTLCDSNKNLVPDASEHYQYSYSAVGDVWAEIKPGVTLEAWRDTGAGAVSRGTAYVDLSNMAAQRGVVFAGNKDGGNECIPCPTADMV
eukprot:scpid35055/ scgid19111/ 